MSRRNLTIIENSEFIKRFVEVCGTSQPAEVARLLNISYQAATNYLNGRVPEAKVLLIISEKTSYSLHWLLTGQGEKIVEDKSAKDTHLLTDEMRTFVREICAEVIDQLTAARKNTTQTKTVILTSDEIRSEKVLNNFQTLTDKESEPDSYLPEY